jgi:hypothetical protein
MERQSIESFRNIAQHIQDTRKKKRNESVFENLLKTFLYLLLNFRSFWIILFFSINYQCHFLFFPSVRFELGMLDYKSPNVRQSQGTAKDLILGRCQISKSVISVLVATALLLQTKYKGCYSKPIAILKTI